MPVESQVRKIIIQTELKGKAALQAASKNLGKVAKNTRSAAKSLVTFKRIFAATLASNSIRRLARAADSFQLLQDRIKTFSSSTEEAVKTFEKLRDIARFTRTSIGGLAEVYNRVALSTNELGLTTDQLLGTVTALQQSFRLTGATIAEATGAAIQLTQGLSSGQLRGQELRSVLEANAVFASILSKELGTTRGQLIKFAESGKITSEVVLRALAKNFKDLNDKTKLLGTTFSQAATIGIDQFLFAFNKLNERLGLSSGFAKGIDFLIDKFNSFVDIVLIFADDGNIQKIVSGIEKLAAPFFGLAGIINPVSFGIEKMTDNIKLMSQVIGGDKSLENVENQIKSVGDTIVDLQKRTDLLTRTKKPKFTSFVQSFFGTNEEIEKDLKKAKNRLTELKSLRAELLKKQPGKSGIQKTIEDMIAAMKDLESFQGIPKSLTAIQKLNRSFKLGTITLNEYFEASRRIEIAQLNTKFDEGKISVDKYNSAMLNLAGSMRLLDQITLGLQTGLISVFEAASNVAVQVSSFVRSTFKTLEDSIFEFVKNGTFEFKKFTQAVLDDLTRIIIRASIIAPLANAITGASFGAGGASAGTNVSTGASAGSQFATTAAKGGVFNQGNVVPFANGGVVGSPTTFGLSGGRTGLMGEAGPEAILPLNRGPGGKLGVNAEGLAANVQVNVINNSDAGIETQQRKGENGQDIIDILIIDTVRNAIGSGKLDRDLGQNFGIRRSAV